MKLAVDIGGTYMRLVLSEDGTSFLQDPQKIKTENYPDFVTALIHFLQSAQRSPDQISKILVARTSQNKWVIDQQTLSPIFPDCELTLINDFEANAMGLVDADISGLVHLGGEKTAPDFNECRAVIGAGTGLGLAYISKGQEILKTHGGHMRPAMITQAQVDLFDQLQAFKTNQTIPIYEDVLSGSGILNIYKILAAQHHLDCEYNDTHHLLADGKNDPLVQQALKFFHEIFGVFAHQVLAFGASYGALYLTGGIIDRIISHNLFDADTFFASLYQKNVDIVLRDVRSTPVFWVRDEFISLSGLLKKA